MPRIFAILGICLIAGAVCVFRFGTTADRLEVKYRYLVVEVEGPAEWAKKHSFTIRWQGKDVPLPVVFQIPGSVENFTLGSGGEISGELHIGKERIPVTSKPDTSFQVRNTGNVAFIAENSARSGIVSISIASSVVMSPPEYPGELNLNSTKAQIESSGKILQKRVKQLIAAGSAIVIAPE